MKKRIFLILILIALFMVSNNVYALGIAATTANIECVYGNGIATKLTHYRGSDNNLKFNATLYNYPVVPSVIIDGDEIGNFSFYNTDHAQKNLQSTMQCPDKIRYWKVISFDGEDGEDGNDYNLNGIYSFTWCTDQPLEQNCSHATNAYISEALKTGFNNGWFNNTLSFPIKVTGINLIPTDANTPEGVIPLVGERIKITGNVDGYLATYKLVSDEPQQAINTNKYLQLYQDGVKSKSNKIYAQVGKVITSIKYFNYTSSEYEYVCVAESTEQSDTTSGQSGVVFSRARHEISKPKRDTRGKLYCTNDANLYKRTTEICEVNPGGDNSAGSFCDKYPNIAFVLIDIIQIMQILVPAVVIVFTGIEVGRIVIAGNIEEELPKRKKSIIIRFIVMIAFLFLPIITQLIVSLVEGVSILDVGCLFKGDNITNNDNDLHCLPPSDN